MANATNVPIDPTSLLRAPITPPSAQPAEGPLAVRTLLNFNGTDSYVANLNFANQTLQLSQIAALFVDMSQSDVSLTITIGNSNQVIICKGRTAGYYPILGCAPGNPITFTFSATGANAFVPVYFINVLIHGVVWPTL